jgi:hypothetical protein
VRPAQAEVGHFDMAPALQRREDHEVLAAAQALEKSVAFSQRDPLRIRVDRHPRTLDPAGRVGSRTRNPRQFRDILIRKSHNHPTWSRHV